MQAIFSIFFLIFQSFVTVQLRAQQHAARGILPVNSNSLSTLLHTTIFSRAFPSLPYLLLLFSLYPQTGTSRIPPSEVLSSSPLHIYLKPAPAGYFPPSATLCGRLG